MLRRRGQSADSGDRPADDAPVDLYERSLFSRRLVYSGGVVDGKRHGRGTSYHQNGDEAYSGDWRDDKRYGRGKMTFENGTTYEGEWRDDKLCGQGKGVTKDGLVYKGGWSCSKRNGQGSVEYTDGASYKGEWKDDKRHGQGKMVYKDGSGYDGGWEDDKRHGRGTVIRTNIRTNGALIYATKWALGVVTDQEAYYPSGNMWYRTRRSGRFCVVYYDGDGERVMYDGGWCDDRRHGPGVSRHPNGEIEFDCTWREGYADGLVVRYGPDGAVVSRGEWAGGKLAHGVRFVDGREVRVSCGEW